jgi:hypothetical protein
MSAFECACGKYGRLKHRGVICDVCSVSVRLYGHNAETYASEFTSINQSPMSAFRWVISPIPFFKRCNARLSKWIGWRIFMIKQWAFVAKSKLRRRMLEPY